MAGTITASFGEPIKQYPGQMQVTRAVRVKAPGKFFNNLSSAERALDYWVGAVEYRERYAFERHQKGWGAAHTGPGVRFVAESDAIDDPDHKGFWTTLALWNRWRHETYLNNRDEEKQYLDELPAVPVTTTAAAAASDKKAPPPAIKQYYTMAEGKYSFLESVGSGWEPLISP